MITMKYSLTWLIIFLCPFLCSAQKKLSKKQFIKDSIEIMTPVIIRPQLRVDNRVAYHKGQRLTLNGIDGGVLLKEKLRLALGYYALNDNLSAYDTQIDGIETERQIHLQYGSINTEYIYLNKRFFSLGLPLDFGFGKNALSYRNTTTGEITGKESGLVFLTDFGFSAIFKPIRWIGVKGVLGYRKFITSPIKEFNFDGPFNSIGLSVDIREIIKDVRMYKLKKKHKRGNPLGNAVDLITD
jgi:hypothetical protein